jgi:hypothetical protein
MVYFHSTNQRLVKIIVKLTICYLSDNSFPFAPPPATASVFSLPHSVLACGPRLGSHTAMTRCTFGGSMEFCRPNTYLRVAYQRATSEDAMRQRRRI